MNEPCDFYEVSPGVLRCRHCRREFPKPRVMPLHAACPKRAPRPAKPAGGAGTELKNLLKRLGIVAKAGCGCDARQALLDAMGTSWCRDNADKIAEEMAAEGKTRGWLFSPKWGAKRLLRWAIAKAEKKAAKAAEKDVPK